MPRLVCNSGVLFSEIIQVKTLEVTSVKKSELHNLRKYAGNMETLYGIREAMLVDGPEKGVRVFDVRNGKGLEFTVLSDRGMDIPFLRYKGMNIGFGSKVEIKGPQFYAEDGNRGFLRQFDGGFLTTCGITYAGTCTQDDGEMLGMHGPYSNTPAKHVVAEEVYEGDEIILRLRGQVREACLYGSNMLVMREIRVNTECNRIQIIDTTENQGFEPEPLMLLYHINFGYPMLDEGARLNINSKKITAKSEFAISEMDSYDRMIAPQIGRSDQCYHHEGFGEQGIAVVENEKRKVSATIRFNTKQMPYLCEWKCMRAGDYALGIEPSVSGVQNRTLAKERGTLRYLEPGETYVSGFEIEFRDLD